MRGKDFTLIGIILIAISLQDAYAINAFENCFEYNSFKQVDTLLPIKVITTDKMNIMVDHQKELVALQWKGLNKEDRNVILSDSSGKIYDQKQMYAGSTIVYFETQTLYEGNYILKVSDQPEWIYKDIKIIKPE